MSDRSHRLHDRGDGKMNAFLCKVTASLHVVHFSRGVNLLVREFATVFTSTYAILTAEQKQYEEFNEYPNTRLSHKNC